MARIQKRGKAGKRLKKGKKLEATRPLKTPATGGTATQAKPVKFLTFKMQDVLISS